jgi:hypothetical protein
MENSGDSSKNYKELPYDPAILLLVICLKVLKAGP